MIGIVKTNIYNSARHASLFSDSELFSPQGAQEHDVSVAADVRDSTWSKVFDINNEGIEEQNYQAYTVDFYVTNNKKDEVRDFSFKLNFHDTTFLLSAWNGGIEIHQMSDAGEIVDLITLSTFRAVPLMPWRCPLNPGRQACPD